MDFITQIKSALGYIDSWDRASEEGIQALFESEFLTPEELNHVRNWVAGVNTARRRIEDYIKEQQLLE